MRLPPLILFGVTALIGAEVPARGPLEQAEAEYRLSQKRASQLEQRAEKLGSRVEQLRTAQQAAVTEIDAAEARITLAGIRVRDAETKAAIIRRQLAEARRPASMLLAGLATMSRRPPILALADTHDVDALVRTKLLLDATMPVIRKRADILQRRAAAAGDVVAAARNARAELGRSRAALEGRKRRLASLEDAVDKEAQSVGADAIGAGDSVLRAAESVSALRRGQSAGQAMAETARELAKLDAFPDRLPGTKGRDGPPGYRLPAYALVSVGLGAVDDGGVRARGLTMDTPRGAPIAAPAAGTILFAGPYQGIDGLLIIDHGGGWLSVLTNVGAQSRKGARIAAGDPVGRALGPIGIELSHDGIYYSPALIAGSFGTLSNGRRNR
jgi:septal ring factor EnvC (AmiA/AmiB activator)